MSAPSSLRSSLDSEASAVGPLQLDGAAAPSRLRRLSNATTSLFSPASRATGRDSLRSEPCEDGHGIREADFGADGLPHSLGRPADAESHVSGKDSESATSLDSEAGDVVVPAAPGPAPGSAPASLRRRRSTVVVAFGNLTKKLGFWDRDFRSGRANIVTTLLCNLVYLLLGFSCALCIYWGAYYNRTHHYRNIRFAVVNADAGGSDAPPVLGEYVASFFRSPQAAAYGSFDVWDYARISASAAVRNSSVDAEVRRMVHHRHYQAAFFVHTNATAAMARALAAHNASFAPGSDLMTVYYETGSDYNAMNNGVVGVVQVLTAAFSAAVSRGPWTAFWLRTLAPATLSGVLRDSPQLLTALPNFAVHDGLPVVRQVVQAPMQIGLIYLCTFTFFQFLFALPIHMSVLGKLKGLPFIFFRIGTSHFSYVVLGLSFTVLNAAFGIDFATTFGRSGFLVVWAIAYLTMASIGSLIEVLVLLCFTFKPPMIGMVLLFIAVLNMAPTISPIYLCPRFYRYGYAMPVYNAYHLLQVAYFNAWKGQMGRHFGVLVAWVVCTTALLPFVLKFVSRKMEEKKVAAAAAAAAAATAASRPLSVSSVDPSLHEKSRSNSASHSNDRDTDRYPVELPVRDHRHEEVIQNAR